MVFYNKKNNLKLCENCNGTGFVRNPWSEFFVKMEANVYGDILKEKPYLLVIHSGAKGEAVAEYFAKTNRYRSAHIAWSKKHKDFVQCVPFDRRAYHVKGSLGVYEGRKHVNGFAIGIELPGPFDQKFPEDVIQKFVIAVSNILIEVPTITTAVRHKDIQENKRDPGDGFEWNWLDSFSRLTLPFDLRARN